MFGEGFPVLAITPLDPKLIIFPVVWVRCLKRLALSVTGTLDSSSRKNNAT